MSRIASNLSGIERSLLQSMAQSNAQVAKSTLRLATMQKINHPSDDPAAFVTLSSFQSQLSNVTSVMSNVTAASSVLTQTESAVSQVQAQLEIIRGALLTPTSSSQATIDQALAEINELAGTEVNGRRVLDGSASYTVTGKNSSQVANLAVYATRGGEGISGAVLTPGTQATLRYTGSSGATTAAATITVTGNVGSAQIAVTNGETLTDLAKAVNAVSYQTGVTASASGDNLDMTSVGYGSEAKVAVEVTDGTFVVTGGDGAGTDYGTSGTAEINGAQYTASAAEGNTYTVSESGFRFQIKFQPTFSGNFDTMQVSGSAMTFALSTDVSQLATLSIPSVQTSYLGGDAGRLDQIGSGGAYSGLGDNRSHALTIVNEAISQVTTLQGYIGGFSAASVDSASALLTDLQTNLQESIDAIDLVDAGEETERISFYSALADNAISGLAIVNQQRSTIVDMIKHIAGLA
jgi:flagellin